MNQTVGTDIHLMFALLVYVGLRRGELVALKWCDIDFNNKTIHICRNTVIADGELISKTPKTQAGTRNVPIGDHLVDLLKKAHKDYLTNKTLYGKVFFDTDLVISQANGKGYHPDSITQKWERFADNNGLAVRLHDLRHTCATLMIANGVPIKTVSERLGHADCSITMNIYVHSTQEGSDKAIETMDSIIFPTA